MTLVKKIEADDDLPKLVVPLAIDLGLVLSAKIADMDLVDQILEKAIEDVQQRFERDGYQVFVRQGLVRPITQEELLAMLPRKVHRSDGKGKWRCTTPHVALKNITGIDKDVTCKLCLRTL